MMRTLVILAALLAIVAYAACVEVSEEPKPTAETAASTLPEANNKEKRGIFGHYYGGYYPHYGNYFHGYGGYPHFGGYYPHYGGYYPHYRGYGYHPYGFFHH